MGRRLHVCVDAGRVLLRLVRGRCLFAAHFGVAGLDVQDDRPGHVGGRASPVHPPPPRRPLPRWRWCAMGVEQAAAGDPGDAWPDVVAGSAVGVRGVRTGSGSGRRSLGACRARTPPSRRACHPRSGRGGSVKLAACRRSRSAPLSGRYLSFAEREEIAILHAQRCGVREIARRIGRSPSTISRELRRNAATRSDRLDVSGDDGAVACRAAGPSPEGRQARRQRSRCASTCRTVSPATIDRPDGELVPGPTVRWIGRRHGRRAGPAVGEVVEPGADLEPAPGRLPR